MILGLPKSHDFLSSWSLWEQKIFNLARIEAPTRPGMKKLLENYLGCKDGSCEAGDDGMHNLVCDTNFNKLLCRAFLQECSPT